MGETESPREALGAPDVTTRAAAARDLGRTGTWDDLERLVKMATTDKSSAVRLWTASAAADIAGRQRGSYGQKTLDAAARQQIHGWVKAIDPGANPSMLMLLSAAADEAAIERLGRMVRDPRNGVRAGAATAIRRMALPAAGMTVNVLRAAISEWLIDRKLRPDMALELVQLIGEAGFAEHLAAIQPLAGGGKAHQAAVDKASERIAHRGGDAAWTGLWVSDGLDVFESFPGARDEDWLLLAGGRLVGASDKVAAYTLGDAMATSPAGLMRLVFAPKQGNPDPVAALQRNGRTYWKVPERDLAEALDEREEALTALGPDALKALAARLSTVDSAAAARARGTLLWRTGDLDGAAAALEEAANGKRPRVEAFYFLARVRIEQGRKADAKTALDAFLEKSAKKAPLRKEAEALRAELG